MVEVAYVEQSDQGDNNAKTRPTIHRDTKKHKGSARCKSRSAAPGNAQASAAGDVAARTASTPSHRRCRRLETLVRQRRMKRVATPGALPGAFLLLVQTKVPGL